MKYIIDSVIETTNTYNGLIYIAEIRIDGCII